MKSSERLVQIRLDETTPVELSCSDRWELVDRVEGDLAFFADLAERGDQATRWRFFCHQHRLEVPLRQNPADMVCPGRRCLSPGVHEMPVGLAESLVKRGQATFVEQAPPSPGRSESLLNETLTRVGLPRLTPGELDFVRRAVKAAPTKTPGRPESLSREDLDDIRGILKELRDRG